MPKASPEPASPGRRSFCILACAAVALAPLSLGAEAPAPQDPRRVTPETRASLGKGGIKDFRKQGGFYLIADGGGIYAVSSICTHNGCSVLLEEGRSFGCPCHDSEYDLQGNVLQGPARLPLKHFHVSEQGPGGPLVVDLGRVVDPHVRF
ncbi:QcrA and Rieske domain-containing protein [Mesoterricola silvestris]|uniref:Rieske domain-containing protein n=1 Tax=Mesoterricola silvestris TaxID=2927979 RepID=A0AA48K9U4_9BACT|nr:Rieske (2Fe-2S) protein [Mesoterricola silvestris]BDU74344.1 hypothetical protein METEAL_35180 [Mesoterricola silvestris]